MKRGLQALLIALFAVSFQSYAQEEESVETHMENVGVEMGIPGAKLNVNVKVRQKTTVEQTGMRYQEPREEAPPPPPAYMGRDCGTGNDPGCNMMRNMHRPMDAEEFHGFLQALRTNDFELNRIDIVKSTLKSSYLTAKQLGLVLDLFENEINRFDVAKAAAPRVVNPKHALGLSSKFENSIYATDFTKLMTSQR
jgi:hypothetical protein